MTELFFKRLLVFLLLICSGLTISLTVQAQVQDNEQRAIKAMLVSGTPDAPEAVIDEAVRQVLAENIERGKKLS